MKNPPPLLTAQRRYSSLDLENCFAWTFPFKNWMVIITPSPVHFDEVPDIPPIVILDDSVGEPSISFTSSCVIPVRILSKLSWFSLKLQEIRTKKIAVIKTGFDMFETIFLSMKVPPHKVLRRSSRSRNIQVNIITDGPGSLYFSGLQALESPFADSMVTASIIAPPFREGRVRALIRP